MSRSFRDFHSEIVLNLMGAFAANICAAIAGPSEDFSAYAIREAGQRRNRDLRDLQRIMTK